MVDVFAMATVLVIAFFVGMAIGGLLMYRVTLDIIDEYEDELAGER